MKRRYFSNLVLTAAAIASRAQAEGKKQFVRPTNGLVPNESTAIKIAVAVWEPIYGKSRIAEQAPYKASLKDGVWVVTGSLRVESLGGTAIAEITKADGRILRVYHGQ